MGATASLDRSELNVEPGATISAVLRIRNTGQVLDQFRVEILGPAAGWSHMEPPSLPLFPGADGTMTLIAAPPRSSAVPAGSCPFGLKVHAAEDAEGSVVADGVITIAPFFDVKADLIPRTSRGRRTGLHDLAVDNRSNVHFNADFTGSDPDSVLGFAFNPPVLSVGPGNAGFTKVRVKARRRFWRGTPVTRPFEVQVRNDQFPPDFTDPANLPLAGTDNPTGPLPAMPTAPVGLTPTSPPPGAPSPGGAPSPAGAPSPGGPSPSDRPSPAVAPTLSVEGSLLQEAILPKWLPQVIAAIVALALIVTLLWFTLFKPQIKSAAKDQVSHQLAAAGVSVPTSTSAPATGSGATTGGAAGSSSPTGTSTSGSPSSGYGGEAVDGRLGVTGNATQTYTVPRGKVLQLTDVDFQNPAGNTGTVILARNNAVLFQLALANFRDLDYHWISPIVFASGDQLQLITTGCSATCSPGLYYAGYLANS